MPHLQADLSITPYHILPLSTHLDREGRAVRGKAAGGQQTGRLLPEVGHALA